jgi:hypothetical protein
MTTAAKKAQLNVIFLGEIRYAASTINKLIGGAQVFVVPPGGYAADGNRDDLRIRQGQLGRV